VYSPSVSNCGVLMQTFRTIIEAVPAVGTTCHLTIGTHNGTVAMASEWGRTLRALPVSMAAGRHWFPAMNFGDTGAAAQIVSASLGAQAFARGYAQSPLMMSWASGPRGSKGVLCLADPRLPAGGGA
jgi:hypothetical protein